MATTVSSTSRNTSDLPPQGDCLGALDLQKTLDILTKELFGQLGNTGQTLFLFGDGVQRLAVENVFDLFSPQTWTPANVLRMSSLAGRQALRISELCANPEAASLAWQELRNKIEVFYLVRNLESVLGISSDDTRPLHALVEKAYSLPAFQALWAVEGLGHYYAASYWRLHGPPKRLLGEENVLVPEKSLLMLHAGMGLFFGDWLLGLGTPSLTVNSPHSQFRSVVERFVELATDNAQKGFLGPVIESLGLVTRDVYPDMVHSVYAALLEQAPELAGYYLHGVGRALYFSRRYFLPVLSTVWSGIDSEAQTSPQQNNAMAGLAWAVVLVNMRQPEILEGILRNYVADSKLQDSFSNGVASSVIMRQATTPDASFIAALYDYRPADPRLIPLWTRLLTLPATVALNKYYPVLRKHRALGEVFRYQDLAELTSCLEGGPTRPQERNVAERRAVNPWTWQDRLGFSQAIEIRGGERVVHCAGQVSVDGSGTPLFARDMAKQINQALDNLEVVLKDAGLTLANVVRLNYYTTDMAALSNAAPAYGPRLAAAGCKPAATAVAVTSLFHPDLMIEIEATAVA